MKIKPQYLQLAALYSSQVRGMQDLDSSRGALEACFMYESQGVVLDGWTLSNNDLRNSAGQLNAYLLGKWMLDINMASIVEDIRNGVMAKAEFMDCEYAWYYWPRVVHIHIPAENGVFSKNPV